MFCGALGEISRVGAGAGGRQTAISFDPNRHWDGPCLPLADETNFPARVRGGGRLGRRDIPLAGDRAAGDFVRLPWRLAVPPATAVAHAHLTTPALAVLRWTGAAFCDSGVSAAACGLAVARLGVIAVVAGKIASLQAW
jgi:hypothetical protein